MAIGLARHGPGTARNFSGRHGTSCLRAVPARAYGLIFGPCQLDQLGENIGPCQPTARNSVNTTANSALTSVFKFGIKFHGKHKG